MKKVVALLIVVVIAFQTSISVLAISTNSLEAASVGYSDTLIEFDSPELLPPKLSAFLLENSAISASSKIRIMNLYNNSRTALCGNAISIVTEFNGEMICEYFVNYIEGPNGEVMKNRATRAGTEWEFDLGTTGSVVHAVVAYDEYYSTWRKGYRPYAVMGTYLKNSSSLAATDLLVEAYASGTLCYTSNLTPVYDSNGNIIIAGHQVLLTVASPDTNTIYSKTNAMTSGRCVVLEGTPVNYFSLGYSIKIGGKVYSDNIYI